MRNGPYSPAEYFNNDGKKEEKKDGKKEEKKQGDNVDQGKAEGKAAAKEETKEEAKEEAKEDHGAAPAGGIAELGLSQKPKKDEESA